jgi:hypothetical protein
MRGFNSGVMYIDYGRMKNGIEPAKARNIDRRHLLQEIEDIVGYLF